MVLVQRPCGAQDEGGSRAEAEAAWEPDPTCWASRHLVGLVFIHGDAGGARVPSD
jgi:hypothetical protein